MAMGREVGRGWSWIEGWLDWVQFGWMGRCRVCVWVTTLYWCLLVWEMDGWMGRLIKKIGVSLIIAVLP